MKDQHGFRHFWYSSLLDLTIREPSSCGTTRGTMDRPTFAAFPVELLEEIALLLDLQDRCNLRLTSRAIANKTSFCSFRLFFERKKVRLTPESLERFIDVTQSGWQGCYLQHLTVMDVPTPNGPTVPERRAADLLRQAMRNFSINSGYGGLRSLTLTIEADPDAATNAGTPWKRVWDAAAHVFRATALALARSHLAVETLNIFYDVDCCSLPCGEFAKLWRKANLSDSLAHTTTVALSLSHQQSNRQRNRRMPPFKVGRTNTHAITYFLNLCPKLETLQLHWYNLDLLNLTEAQKEEQLFFNRIVDFCRFEGLKHLTLKGIYTSEMKLHYFLRHIRLRSLSMEQIRLDRGTFRPIFEYLSLNMRQLRYIHFDDFWEEKLLYFEAPGQPHFPSAGGLNLPNAITRTGSDARKLVEYRFSPGRSLVSDECTQWVEKHWRLYGPPRAVYG
ncbi:hypothetical protein BDV28DRAFT_140955 [Aspergillus coremiiformis]|uniref:F-box domain-containing protein n=1 Tax=Aspergillus coremiiformis TaxID=138285 RepID=A0A5N6YWU0_9EURO|nr:hypothetical protein BDV28DRAFT_140955 [Aspergillus coremiiformis]